MGILPGFLRGRVWHCCELSLLVATIRASVRCPAPDPSGHSNPDEGFMIDRSLARGMPQPGVWVSFED
jgi:hypothetical protein